MLPMPVMMKITTEGKTVTCISFAKGPPNGSQKLGLLPKERSADGTCDQAHEDLCCKA